jgi:hypothetical protein
MDYVNAMRTEYSIRIIPMHGIIAYMIQQCN